MRKNFSFNLEPVRALREQAERQAQEDLAAELAREVSQKTALSDASRRAAAARQARTPRSGSVVTGHDLRASEAFVARTENEHEAARRNLAAQEQEVADSRGRLVEAGRQREILERLKRRRASEHARESARREEHSLAEIALTAYLRNPHRNAA
jgi:flagellar protein FliJ